MCPLYFNYYNYFDVCCKHLSFGRASNPSKSVYGSKKTSPSRPWRTFAAIGALRHAGSVERTSARPALVLRATPPPGSCGRGPVPMGCEVLPPESCDVALGGALIARDVYNGAGGMGGIEVGDLRMVLQKIHHTAHGRFDWDDYEENGVL